MLKARGSAALAALAVFALAGAIGFGRATPATSGGAQAAGGGATGAQFVPGVAQITRVGDSLVGAPVTAYSSRALRDLPQIQTTPGKPQGEGDNTQIPVKNHVDQPDPLVQRTFGLPGSPIIPHMPNPDTSWEGINQSQTGYTPPDTNGAVGPTQYVQTVNAAMAVWSKTGSLLSGPININQLWAGQNNLCSNTNNGDPIVLYDHIDNRWLVSQFAFTSPTTGPFGECIAISKTGDATGQYWTYTFILDNNYFEDYPHFGIWPDGYYMAMNEFDSAGSQRGPRMFVFNRTPMLSGANAAFQSTTIPAGAAGLFMPSDLDGPTLPPAGAPNYVLAGIGSMHVWKYHVDWNSPANSSFTLAADLPVAGFTQLCPGARGCLLQPGTANKLDGLGDRLMYRAAYRNLNGVERIVVNHSVDIGSITAGVRWYEVRNLNSTPSLYQQGTYGPADGNSRWGASAAQDKDGNTALGFTVVSAGAYPSIHYTGRLDSDPLGTLPQGEATLINGTGSQTGPANAINRWGDYSALTVDPSDDCTFWYTSEYYASTGQTWQTRVGSFKFPTCGGTPVTPTATVTPDPNSSSAMSAPATTSSPRCSTWSSTARSAAIPTAASAPTTTPRAAS